jgi:Family of unknown function (DUF6232)
MDDDIIFSQGDVIVTKALVRIGGVSYPVNGIGSVLVQKPKPSVLFFISGILVAVPGVAVLFGEGNFSGLIAVGLGAICMYLAFSKPSTLVLRTASGDQNVLQNKDTELLQKVKKAVETAVVRRG